MTESTGDLSEIQEIGTEAKELLEATGVETLLSLAESEASTLRQEMEHANGMLELTPEVPTIDELQRWIDRSQSILDYKPEELVPRLEPVDEVEVREVLYAIPVPAKNLVKQNVPVNQIPVMDTFIEGDEDLNRTPEPPAEVLANEAGLPLAIDLPPAPDPSKVAGPKVVQIEPKKRVPLDIESDSQESRDEPIKPLVSDIADIRKAPSVGLNVGKTPHSRGYIRGVLHPQPGRIRVAAMLTILTMLLFVSSIVAGALIMLKYPLWVALIPAVFLVFLFLYATIARGMSCRICGQPIFSPKACRKHVKAHHIRFLGYILPTCIHVLLFSWFRCIYCGTSVRVKE